MTEEILATHQILSLFEQSKQMSDQILDNLSGIFVNIDRSGKILRANRHVANLLGLSFEEVINEELKRLFLEVHWAIFQGHLQKVSESGVTSTEFELEISTKTESRWYLWQISLLPRRGKGKEDQIFTCLARDVTDVRTAQAMAKDLELTKAMQTLLLPSTNEFRTPRLDLAAAYQPTATAGGDFWWMNIVTEDKLWIILGDVTGHGAGSAMVTSMISGTIETLRNVHKPENLSLTRILEAINQCLCGLRGRPYWMTATAIEIDFDKDLIQWLGAASPPIYVQRKSGEVEIIEFASSHLGSEEVVDLNSGSVEFHTGDKVLLLTDGLFEATRADGAQFGLLRIHRYLRSVGELPVKAIRDGLLDAVKDWCPAPDDDIAVVLIERLS